jgi:hypothetical protein
MGKTRKQDNAGLAREEAIVRFARSGYDLNVLSVVE